MKQKPCVVCGIIFTAKTNGVLCSGSCRVVHYRALHKRKREEAPEKYKEHQRRWRERNPESVAEIQARSRLKHIESRRERDRDFYGKHKEERRLKALKRYWANIEKERERRKESYYRRHDTELLRMARFREENRERLREKERKRGLIETAAVHALKQIGLPIPIFAEDGKGAWHVQRRMAIKVLREITSTSAGE